MAKVAILFGWPRCGTQTIGRMLTVSGKVRWDGEFLRQSSPPAATWQQWLDDARAWTRDEWVVGKILPDHLQGFDAVSAALAAGVHAAWAGRQSWGDAVCSMASAAERGAWFFPIRTFPPAQGRLSTAQLNEGGLQEAFDAAFPAAARSSLSSFRPADFIRDWLGVIIRQDPRPFIFSRIELTPAMPAHPFRI